MNKYRIIKKEFADGSAIFTVQEKFIFFWIDSFWIDSKRYDCSYYLDCEFDSEELAIKYIDNILKSKLKSRLVKTTILKPKLYYRNMGLPMQPPPLPPRTK